MVKIVFLGYILWEKTIIYLACFVHCVSMCCHFFVHVITLNYHYPSSLLLSLLWPIVFLSVVNFVTALILPTLNYYQLVISELSFYHCHLSFYVELTFYELSTIILLTLKTILLGCIYVGCSNKLSLSLSPPAFCAHSQNVHWIRAKDIVQKQKKDGCSSLNFLGGFHGQGKCMEIPASNGLHH